MRRVLAADSQLARCNGHSAERKGLQTQTYTSRDTSRHGRCDGELAGASWGRFCRNRDWFVRNRRTSISEVVSTTQIPHRIWPKRTARPCLSIVADGSPTKLSGVGVRLGSIKCDRLGAGALGLAHDRELRHFEARKGARKTVYSPTRLVFSSSSRVSSRPQFLAAVPASETCRAPAITT